MRETIEFQKLFRNFANRKTIEEYVPNKLKYTPDI